MSRLFHSLTGRLLVIILTVHLLLVPALFVYLLKLVEHNYTDHFINQVRADAQWTATLLGGISDKNILEKLIYDLSLTGLRSYVAILDNSGIPVTNPDRLPANTTDADMEDFFFGQHDDSYYSIVAPLLNADGDSIGSVHIAYNEQPIKDDIADLYRRFTMIAIAYFVLIVFAIILFSHHLSRSLRRLGEAAHRVAAGHYDSHFSQAERLTEIRQLSQDLERMRSRLVSHGRTLADKELRIRTVVENISDAVVTFEPGGIIESANPAAGRLFSKTSDTIIGENFHALIGDDAIRDTGELLESGVHEHTMRRKDGSNITVEIALSRISQGGRSLILGVLHDISARKQIEAEKHRYQNQMAHAGRLSSLGEMAAGLAHELNQPLASTIMYIEGSLKRMRLDDVPKELVTAMESARAQAQRASDIIRQTRSYIRRAPLERERVDVNELVSRTFRLLDATLEKDEIDVRFRYTGNMAFVEVDVLQLQQVLINLVTNAVEAMRDTGGSRRTLTVSTGEEGASVVVTVADAGPGVPDELAQQVFHPFVTGRPGGLGLGLSISQSVIEEHGGELWFRNDPVTGGAIFGFSLPKETGGTPT